MAYFVFACIEQVKAVWVGDDGGGLSMDAQGMLREMHAVICGKKEEAVLLSFDKEIVEISGAYGIQTVLIKEGRGGRKEVRLRGYNEVPYYLLAVQSRLVSYSSEHDYSIGCSNAQ